MKHSYSVEIVRDILSELNLDLGDSILIGQALLGHKYGSGLESFVFSELQATRQSHIISMHETESFDSDRKSSGAKRNKKSTNSVVETFEKYGVPYLIPNQENNAVYVSLQDNLKEKEIFLKSGGESMQAIDHLNRGIMYGFPEEDIVEFAIERTPEMQNKKEELMDIIDYLKKEIFTDYASVEVLGEKVDEEIFDKLDLNCEELIYFNDVRSFDEMRGIEIAKRKANTILQIYGENVLREYAEYNKRLAVRG
ncbi:MAG: hypothetical protein KAU95_03570 [Candidatus Aenigmarchaeota archaeon]|nr:hypothetical protein [Candidatus Aenigmarchaeota archaeon]